MEKKTILTISDMPWYVSGVAHQAREFIEALFQTGRYKFICVGGGRKPDNPQPFFPSEEVFGQDVIVYPVEHYGDKQTIRSLISMHKPDMLWYQTDPRFFEWLHTMTDEILINMPIVWYTIWDNYPIPKFNKKLYKCNSHLACISKITYNIVKELVPEVDSTYMPHFVNDEIFRKYDDEEIKQAKIELLGEKNKDKFIFFYNSRNAQRKLTGSTIYWFKRFLEKKNIKDAILLMHTKALDPYGQNLNAILNDFGLTNGEVKLTPQDIPALSPQQIATLYNISDCTILLSNAEGWGLSITEAMSCEKPVISTATGGMLDQIIGDDGEAFGVAIEPTTKLLVGSQQVPYIFEDRVNEETVIDAMFKMYSMSKEDRDKIGKKARQHVVDHYDYKVMRQKWVELIDEIIEKNGSWDTRKNYKAWEKFEY